MYFNTFSRYQIEGGAGTWFIVGGELVILE
jgi:hypothetical protein